MVVGNTGRGERITELLQELSAVSVDVSRAFAQRHGLHPTDARAVLELQLAAADGRPLTAGALGGALDLSPAAVTALIDRLVGAGHVSRRGDPQDRRRVLLVVEPAAADLGERWFRPLADALAAVSGTREEAELVVIDDFLTEVVAAMRAHLDHPAR